MQPGAPAPEQPAAARLAAAAASGLAVQGGSAAAGARAPQQHPEQAGVARLQADAPAPGKEGKISVRIKLRRSGAAASSSAAPSAGLANPDPSEPAPAASGSAAPPEREAVPAEPARSDARKRLRADEAGEEAEVEAPARSAGAEGLHPMPTPVSAVAEPAAAGEERPTKRARVGAAEEPPAADGAASAGAVAGAAPHADGASGGRPEQVSAPQQIRERDALLPSTAGGAAAASDGDRTHVGGGAGNGPGNEGSLAAASEAPLPDALAANTPERAAPATDGGMLAGNRAAGACGAGAGVAPHGMALADADGDAEEDDVGFPVWLPDLSAEDEGGGGGGVEGDLDGSHSYPSIERSTREPDAPTHCPTPASAHAPHPPLSQPGADGGAAGGAAAASQADAAARAPAAEAAQGAQGTAAGPLSAARDANVEGAAPAEGCAGGEQAVLAPASGQGPEAVSAPAAGEGELMQAKEAMGDGVHNDSAFGPPPAPVANGAAAGSAHDAAGQRGGPWQGGQQGQGAEGAAAALGDGNAPLQPLKLRVKLFKQAGGDAQ